MQYVPKKSKFKKYHKGKKLFKLKNTINLNKLNTNLGLKSIEPGRLTSKQIIVLRQTINKIIKKRGKNFIRVFPSIGVSKKPKEIRMGKGKGAVDHWVCKIKAGVLLCEMFVLSLSIGLKALKLVQKKLPFKTKILKKTD
jgi:large subunit ribosomal protein L16